VVVIAMLLVDPCHKVVTTLSLLGIFVTRLSQPCHYHVACRQPYHKFVTTLHDLVFVCMRWLTKLTFDSEILPTHYTLCIAMIKA